MTRAIQSAAASSVCVPRLCQPCGSSRTRDAFARLTQPWHTRNRLFATLASLLLPLVSGCGGSGPDAIPLVVVSPHRDEIREEVGWAFPGWFQQRTQAKIDRARAALQQTAREPIDAAFLDLFQDWNPTDLPEVHRAWQDWQIQATPARVEALGAALARWSPPPVRLVWFDVGGTSQIARYIDARYASQGRDPKEGIGIDVLFGGGTDTYIRFAGTGYLEKVTLPKAIQQRLRPDLNGVPLYDPQGRWYGAMLSSFGILYNRWVLERIGQPEPRQWADLGRPALQGWVNAGDPRWTGSAHMVYEIILQGQGWDDGFSQLLHLGANTHSFLTDSGRLTRSVSLGEVAAAGNVDANAFIALAQEPRILGYHLPAGETIINPDAVAVLLNTPRPGLARAFVEFLLDDAGQRLFFLQPGVPGGPRKYPLCRLSIVESLYEQYPLDQRSVGDVNPFAVQNTFTYNSKLGDRRWNALNDLIGAVIVDAHPDLFAAWQALIASSMSAGRRQQLEAELFAPFCTEAELLEHARRIKEDGPRYRTEAVNAWGRAARERYQLVRKAAQE
jgi:iron(III) transport system substrate-binding protein